MTEVVCRRLFVVCELPNRNVSIEYHPDEFARSTHPIPGWLFSTALHFVLLLALALLMSSRDGGTSDEPDRAVGIAIAHRLPDRTTYESEPLHAVESSAEHVPATQSASGASTLAKAAESPPVLDLGDVLAKALDAPLPNGVGDETEVIGSAAASSGDPRRKLGRSGSKHTTEVFGISGTGNRFVYVFDRSESMNGFGGRPLYAAKQQMIESIRSLGPEQEFQIIFYNTEPRPFVAGGQMVRLLKGDETTKRQAEQYIGAVTAFGGTRHKDALVMALRMSPDVIFFLSDARIPRMNAAQLQEIRVRAQRSGTTIHTIEFGDDLEAPRDSFLRTLAEQNSGKYRYLRP